MCSYLFRGPLFQNGKLLVQLETCTGWTSATMCSVRDNQKKKLRVSCRNVIQY